MSTTSVLPTLGFLGTGAITTAMVTGFCERAADTPYPIVVSPQYEANAAKLKEAYPDRVTVAQNLQEVVDCADWVVIAVLPQAGQEVLSSLTFRPEQKIINVMFDKTIEQIREWLNVEVHTMLHMIPGTYLSFYPGPIVQCPPTPEAAEIFGFAPMFAVLDALIGWAISEGVPADAATAYVTNLFAAVTQEACNKDREGVHTMATVSTPGGINMQALELITNAGGFQAWVEAMKPVMARTADGIPKK